MNNKGYYYNESVNIYNEKSQDKYDVRYIDIYDISKRHGLISDCVPLTRACHKAVAETIIDRLRK